MDVVERSMSAPVFELLKRPDELFVVEHAHLRPRFVEDSVRIASPTLLAIEPGLETATRALAPGEPRDDPRPRRRRRAVGQVGEIRAELRRSAARRPSDRRSPTDWLAGDAATSRDASAARAKRGSVPASRRRTLLAMQRDDAPSAASAVNATTGQDAPEGDGQQRKRDSGDHGRQRGVPREREATSQIAAHPRAANGASASATPPPWRPSSRPSRSRGTPDARGRASPRPQRGRRPVAAEPEPERRRNEALERHRAPRPAARATVRRPARRSSRPRCRCRGAGCRRRAGDAAARTRTGSSRRDTRRGR